MILLVLFLCFYGSVSSVFEVFSCCVLILFGFIMVYLIVLFFLSDSFYSVLVSVFFAYRVLDMIRFAMFIVFYGDREWMMPLRFIRRTNIVLLRLFSFCYRCFVCWYECSSF